MSDSANILLLHLYYHDVDSVVPDTSPFGPVTSSRYWMAGLVASGAMLVLYLVASITNSNSFFADSISLQIAIWLFAAVSAWALTRLRRALAVRREAVLTRAV